jgi:hypothetical protein
MKKITGTGFEMAAKNVILFPIRVMFTAMYMFLRFGLVLVIALLLLVSSNGIYFYFEKSNAQLQIDSRTSIYKPPEAMTFQELWQDRFTGWEKIDLQRYESGRSESKKVCSLTPLIIFPVTMLSTLERLVFVRYFPEAEMTKAILANPSRAGYPPPEELSFPDAWWWWSENTIWYLWVDHLHSECQLPPPRRPITVQT